MTDQGSVPPPGDDPTPGRPEPPPPPPDLDDTLEQPLPPVPGSTDPTRIQPAAPPPPPPPPPAPPEQPPETPWWRRGWAIVLWVLLGAALAFGLSRLLADDDEPSTSTTSTAGVPGTSTTGPVATTTSTPVTTTSSTPPSTTTTTAPTTTTTTTPPTTTVPPREALFSDGTHLVGTDIAAGVYETAMLEPLPPGSEPTCSWQRLSGTSGTPDEVIAEAGVDTHGIVEVLATDAALTTTGCGEWFALGPLPDPLVQVPAGVWAVGVHLEPGRYGAPGGETCSWERLSAFTGEPDAVIDGDTVDGSVIVDVVDGDVGFSSTGCGSWAPVG